MRLPAGLDWWRDEPDGAAWLARLPRLVAECAERWELSLGEPLETKISLVVPVTLADRTPAVLKLNFPEPESEHEADALALWDGRGAVRLLAHHEEHRALLVERCLPGTQLWELDDEEATRIAAGALSRIWRPPPDHHAFRLLADEAARWAHELPSRWERLAGPFERPILDEAVSALRELGPEQRELVVCHQDFHGGNVLRARREPWLVIDPKPLVGEREFDTASLIRDRRDDLARDPAPAARIRRRLDALAADLALDRERMRRWAIAHALAWGVDDKGIHTDIVECARLLARA
ncbi:MAG: phosphotransferase [Thermoleophilia bacterium]|nr:phosphotransferase [Thermoleophilia bacterium]